jgi:hypothetical protein
MRRSVSVSTAFLTPTHQHMRLILHTVVNGTAPVSPITAMIAPPGVGKTHVMTTRYYNAVYSEKIKYLSCRSSLWKSEIVDQNKAVIFLDDVDILYKQRFDATMILQTLSDLCSGSQKRPRIVMTGAADLLPYINNEQAPMSLYKKYPGLWNAPPIKTQPVWVDNPSPNDILSVSDMLDGNAVARRRLFSVGSAAASVLKNEPCVSGAPPALTSKTAIVWDTLLSLWRKANKSWVVAPNPEDSWHVHPVSFGELEAALAYMQPQGGVNEEVAMLRARGYLCTGLHGCSLALFPAYAAQLV